MKRHDITKLFKMTQDELFRYVLDQARGHQEKGYDLHYDQDEMWLRVFPKNQGLYPVLAAHLDTVGVNPPDEVRLDDQGIFTGYRNGVRCVLGGDDRCGVWGMLELLGSCEARIGYIFSKEEETKHTGARDLVIKGGLDDIKEQIACFIELDRRGTDRLAHYPCRTAPAFKNQVYRTHANPDFVTALSTFTYNGAAFQLEEGEGTDIQEYCGATGLCGINLSVGYFRAHSPNEYVDSNYMEMLPDITLALISHLGGKRYTIQRDE